MKLANEGNYALGSVIMKFKEYKQIGCNFSQSSLNQELALHVNMVLECEVLKDTSLKKSLPNQYWAMRYFLGVHNKMPILALTCRYWMT